MVRFSIPPVARLGFQAPLLTGRTQLRPTKYSRECIPWSQVYSERMLAVLRMTLACAAARIGQPVFSTGSFYFGAFLSINSLRYQR